MVRAVFRPRGSLLPLNRTVDIENPNSFKWLFPRGAHTACTISDAPISLTFARMLTLRKFQDIQSKLAASRDSLNAKIRTLRAEDGDLIVDDNNPTESPQSHATAHKPTDSAADLEATVCAALKQLYRLGISPRQLMVRSKKSGSKPQLNPNSSRRL